MGGAIFSDMDRSVNLERTDEGLVVEAPCGVCGRHVRVKHPWHELQACLNGQPPPGYQPVAGGWAVTVPCAVTCVGRGGAQNARNYVTYKLTPADIQGT